MVKIYEIGPGGYLGETREIDMDAPAPDGFTRTEPPEVSAGETPKWLGHGWGVRPTPAPTPNPEPEPVIYRNLSRVEFLDHIQTEGGVTDADLVSAHDDANLRVFWIKFDRAMTINRDDSKTVSGLEALASLGYLDAAGRQAVLDNWPTV